MKVTVRDVFWLIIVIALAAGWFVHQRQLRTEARVLETRIGRMEQAVDESGGAITWDGTSVRLTIPPSDLVIVQPIEVP